MTTNNVPDNEAVICPACCHQFRAIPIQVQTLMIDAGFVPPFVEPPIPQQASLISWAVEQWRREVEQRPLHNKHRRTLDDVWRQVIRFAGGDDLALIGPAHDELVTQSDSQPAIPADAEDSARMDFIESHPGWLNVSRPGHKTKQAWSFRPPFTNYEYDVFKTAREAIDARRRIEGESND